MPRWSRASSIRRFVASQMANANMPLNRWTQALAPLLIGVDDDLGIGTGSERMAELDQLLAQFDEVVDLAVEDHLDRAVLVAHRLRSAFDVDDAQAPVAERCGLVHEVAFAVGAAVRQRFRHSNQKRPLRWRTGAVEDACDSAHERRLSVGRAPGCAAACDAARLSGRRWHRPAGRQARAAPPKPCSRTAR